MRKEKTKENKEKIIKAHTQKVTSSTTFAFDSKKI